MKCFLLLLVTILASQALTMASNPGLKLKLLERGLDFGVDSNNKPTMWITSRSCQVDNVHMKFHGGRSRFYNIFSGYVEKKLSSQIRSTIINVMDDLINERLNKTLSNIKGTVLINNVITMDNQLLASPHLGHNYIQSSHKGEMFWTSQPGAVPFSPAPMEEPLGTSKMMTLCLSDYVGNSLGYAFYTYGTSYLRRTLTESDASISLM
ncbi:hypothetical protein LSH36_506g01006 [Paralvinella palmiformis]|uniref:Shell matrix protein n=1 Tax=Paralvinella palmiformis TaxID=53620 RepID=A0AAD9MWF9_9ANNE|nr:hypothetical protein LSH36_506g01006 [Paralvinella palmiformis]